MANKFSQNKPWQLGHMKRTMEHHQGISGTPHQVKKLCNCPPMSCCGCLTGLRKSASYRGGVHGAHHDGQLKFSKDGATISKQQQSCGKVLFCERGLILKGLLRAWMVVVVQKLPTLLEMMGTTGTHFPQPQPTAAKAESMDGCHTQAGQQENWEMWEESLGVVTLHEQHVLQSGKWNQLLTLASCSERLVQRGYLFWTAFAEWSLILNGLFRVGNGSLEPAAETGFLFWTAC